MEQRQNLHECGICGRELTEEHGSEERGSNLCQRCEDAWEREVDCAV